MVDSLIQAELLAACSGLGYSDGISYQLEADCLETVKDLIRYLRRDDDSHQIRRALGDTKVLQTDLIPIIKFHHHNKELFDVTLRLLVNLTNPVLLLFKEELPEEKITRQHYLQMIGHQQTFKEAFADNVVWNVLTRQLGEILEKDWEEREEEERLVVERILILVRNVLVVAASPEEEKRTDDDASVHDQVLWALHLARFEDLILYIASSNNEQALCMHVIEIISLMLKEQDPVQLASAGLQRSQSEKEKDEKELIEIRKREALDKHQKNIRHYSARHSRFGGTYYIMNMKSISERDLITHRPITDIKSLSFDQSKRPKKIPKNRLPMKDFDITRRSTLAIRLFLQEFCIEFLSGAFNSLMYIVKDNINRAKVQEHDESYYMWAIKFFLQFNRNQNFRVELITETLNLQSFHYIQTLLEKYYEMMTTDKKQIPLWSKRMHKALKAYQELLMTLLFMDKSDNIDVCESSRILKNKVFYVVEYRELILILLQNYDELKMSKLYLKDLVETAHICLKLLEGICKKQKHLIVQRTIKSKKKTIKTHSKPETNWPPTEEELVMKWEEKSDDLLAVVKGELGELPSTIPYDPVASLPEEEQKEKTMKRINSLLRSGEFSEAVSLLRSSREIWPEGDIFGASNLDPFEELLCLRMIFMANINDSTREPTFDNNDKEEENEVEDSDEEQVMMESQIREEELDFVGFIRRFSHIKVVQSYALLFRDFLKNNDNVNHCILKMFHRLAWECKIVAIFFQTSIFRTFQTILDQTTVVSQTHRDAVKFARFVIKKFVEISSENPKVFIELMFWKTNKEALEIECGYGSYDSSKTKKALWTEEEEDELRRLYEEFKDASEEGKDVIDLILENLIDQNRTRRTMIRKLREMNLILNIKELRKTITVRAPPWSQEEEMELRTLVEEYLDAVHPIDRILDHMSIKRPKNKVIGKILELGLVESRKNLQKKRTESKTKNYGEKFLRENASEEEEVEESSESDENQNIQGENSTEYVSSKESNSPLSDLIPTPALIQSSLSKALDVGLRDAVEWIADLMQGMAEEREKDGDFEPIPLLTVTESCNKAMESEEFLQLLKVLGVQCPKSHQEMFWRIPAHISVEGLKKRAQFLKQGITGEVVDAKISFDETSLPSLSSKEKKEGKAKLPKQRKRKKIYLEKENISKEIDDRLSVDSFDDDNDELPLSQIKSSNPEGKALEWNISSQGILQEVDNVCGGEKASKRVLVNENEEQETSITKKKKRRIIAGDSDEEIDTLRLHLDTEPTQDDGVFGKDANVSRIYDSDEAESPIRSVKRRTNVMSDDEENTGSRQMSARRKIIDDSDDESV